MIEKKDLDFLFEMGTLRFVPRTWRQFLGANFANVAEHTFRVMWLALYLAKAEGADINKVVMLALAHDITETRTGDVHYVSRLYTERHDEQAFKDMVKETSLEKELIDYWQEYEIRESLEAKIVKDADTLDVDMELMEQLVCGNKIKDALFQARENGASKKLYTESARLLWKKIYETDPHHWHTSGANRFTEGDWKLTK